MILFLTSFEMLGRIYSFSCSQLIFIKLLIHSQTDLVFNLVIQLMIVHLVDLKNLVDIFILLHELRRL